jgi:hypothetical protein
VYHTNEFICERQCRVVQIIYTAELNGLIDTIDKASLVQIVCYQIWCEEDQSAGDDTARAMTTPVDESAARMATLQKSCKLQPPTKGVVDAKTAFDSIRASDDCERAESSLKLQLLA